MSTFSEKGESVVITPSGNILAAGIESFRHELDGLLMEGVKDLSIDFCHVELIDSTGIGSLVAIHNQVKQISGSLTLINVSADIHKMFRIMRLNKHFSVFEKKQESN
jgi:anti-anti-sigma factor